MSNKKQSIPWYFIVLDGIGAIFLVVGVLAMTGFDFGQPVLREVALVFVLAGIAFMVPLVIWMVRRAARSDREA